MDSNNIKRNRIYYRDKIYKDFSKNGWLLNAAFSNLVRGYYSNEDNQDNIYIDYVPQLSLKLKRPYKYSALFDI